MDVAPDAGPTTAQTEELPPTWTRVYEEVIVPKCLPCHASDIGTTRGGLDMSTKIDAYANLVNAPTEGEACTEAGTRVSPGNPDDSIMYLKVSTDDPAPCGAKMPYMLPSLSDEEAELIEDWIRAGARDD
jgi:hypothetical protein